MRIASTLALLTLLGACASQEPAETDTSPLVQCTDPRPQVCTMEYAPACATLKSGGQKEYASGCNACADDAVAAYLPGPCAE